MGHIHRLLAGETMFRTDLWPRLTCFRRVWFVVLFGVACASAGFAEAADAGQAADKNAPQITRYTALPLRFERNLGQANAHVPYIVHGPGYMVLFKRDGSDLFLTARGADRSRLPRHLSNAKPSVSTEWQEEVLGVRMVGAALDTQIKGEDLLQGTANYLIGKDQRNWQTAVPTFARVRYSGIYPGINLLYYGRSQQLEFDFEIASGADAGRIRLGFRGALEIAILGDGDLNIKLENNFIRFRKPTVYQIRPDGSREPVKASFRIHSDGTAGFKVGKYDHTRTW
jgi:hypothetical protein